MNNILQYKAFILETVVRNFKLKYQNSFLGFFWVIAQPISQIFLIIIIFKYSIYQSYDSSFYEIKIFSGMIIWLLFVEIITKSSTMFIEYSNYIKKIKFPIIIIPIIIIIETIINFLIIYLIFVFYLIYITQYRFENIPTTLLIVFLTILLSITIGIIFAIISVYFNDVSHFLTIVLPILFLLTPIVYNKSTLPTFLQNIVDYNPLSNLVQQFQNIYINNLNENYLNYHFYFLLLLLMLISTIIYVNKIKTIADDL